MSNLGNSSGLLDQKFRDWCLKNPTKVNGYISLLISIHFNLNNGTNASNVDYCKRKVISVVRGGNQDFF